MAEKEIIPTGIRFSKTLQCRGPKGDLEKDVGVQTIIQGAKITNPEEVQYKSSYVLKVLCPHQKKDDFCYAKGRDRKERCYLLQQFKEKVLI